MISTPRRRPVVACLLTLALLLTLATPALAAPSEGSPWSDFDGVLSWLLSLVEPSDGLDRVTDSDRAASVNDPDHGDSPLQPFDGGETSNYTPPDDDGEAAPYIDPNG